MYHLTVGTATGISEGDAALGQVRRLRDILGGAFLDAEVVGVWGLRIFVKIYEKSSTTSTLTRSRITPNSIVYIVFLFSNCDYVTPSVTVTRSRSVGDAHRACSTSVSRFRAH